MLDLLHYVINHAADLIAMVQHVTHDPTSLLMLAGGGQPAPPPPIDYGAQSRATMEQQNNQARLDAEAAARAKAEKEAAEAAARQRYQSQVASAYNSAQGYGTSRINSLGINDDYGIMSAYQAELDRARQAIPDLDPNPGNYFTPTLFDNALTQQRGVQRKNLGREFDSFAAPNFELGYFGDNSDDAIIDSIINQQYGDANTYLDRARDRGQLAQTGYDYALRELQNSRPGAVSKANQLGLGVIQKDRDVLSNIAKEGRDRITNWDFGDVFDPSSYDQRLKSQRDALTGSLEGDLRNAFGDTQFFNPATYVTKGGSFQGQQNPATGNPAAAGNPLLGAIGDDELQKRTAGTQGAF